MSESKGDKEMQIDFDVIVPKLDKVLARGLSKGVGKQGGQVCIEAAVCEVLGLPHGDDPGCVAEDVRRFKIRLNDGSWSSPEARAKGLRDLGIAQLGTKDMTGFAARMAEKTIRVMIPKLFREVLGDNPRCMTAADRCEKEGTREAALEARNASASASAAAAYAAAAAAYAAAAAADAAAADASDAAYAFASACAASAAAKRQKAVGDPDEYRVLAAALAVEVLREMGAPGVAWLDAHK